MKKSDLIKLLGGTAEKAAAKLDFAHRNSVQRFPAELIPRQRQSVIMRMKAAHIPIPQEWLDEEAAYRASHSRGKRVKQAAMVSAVQH